MRGIIRILESFSGGGRVNKLRGIVKRDGKNNMMGLDGKKKNGKIYTCRLN